MSRILLLLIFCSVYFTNLHSAELSKSALISVLTCDSGEELYSAFGHSAIRVNDSINNIDITFNYGTFDFDTPNFYLKFANGQLNYMLSASRFKYFLPSYFREKRTVIEQVLNLNQNDKQNIYNALIENYKPENREYKYDFFYDNCATRIFDIIESNIESEITIPESDKYIEVTFREYLHTYLENSPWIKTGLDLILGMPADKIASRVESTYLPNFLMYTLEDASINGTKDSIVKEKKVLIDFSDTPKSASSLLTPAMLAWILLFLGIVLTILSYKFGIKLKWFDGVLFLFTGFIGIIVAYMWFITDHQVPQNNLNILWAVPTAVLIPFLKKGSKVSNICLYYQLVSLIMFVLGWFVLPQSFPLATLPLGILIMVRSVFSLRRT